MNFTRHFAGKANLQKPGSQPVAPKIDLHGGRSGHAHPCRIRPIRAVHAGEIHLGVVGVDRDACAIEWVKRLEFGIQFLLSADAELHLAGSGSHNCIVWKAAGTKSTRGPGLEVGCGHPNM